MAATYHIRRSYKSYGKNFTNSEGSVRVYRMGRN